MKILTWLKSLFTRKESDKMADSTTDTAVTSTAAATPAETEVNAGVKDLKAALAFIESGISHLGEAAKDELVMLAQKYL